MKKLDKHVCRKAQGQAEQGNSCLQTPGTCESCPEWAKQPVFVAIKRAVMRGSDCIAMAKSHTFARRIANALNAWNPNRKGY